jgi:hypothetical protein
MNNLITKLFEENNNDQNIVNKIQKLSEQISRAMINYDAEFKILITNQKIQIAAETSDIFKDTFGRIDLTLSRKSADFETGIDRFKIVGMEMTNLMLDLNELVNNMNERMKNSVKKANIKLLSEIKSNQNEITNIIKYHKFDINTDDIHSIPQIIK